jgi:preprotein translocase subunit YajC
MPQQVFLIVIVGAMVAFMFWQQRKQKKQQQEQDQMRSNFQKGDPVMTTSGMLVLIESVEGDSIVVRGEDGALSRWMKAAITLRPGQTMADLPSQAGAASETEPEAEPAQIENLNDQPSDPATSDTSTDDNNNDDEPAKPAPKKRGRPKKVAAPAE